jgi:hypothetical protein
MDGCHRRPVLPGISPKMHLVAGSWEIPLLAMPPRIRDGVVMGMRQDRSAWKQYRDPAQPAPLPPLAARRRCDCGKCKVCVSDLKWDRIFAKFEVKKEDDWPTRGMFQSTLRGW